MNTYLLVKKMLIKYPETRNSDKELQWRIWEYQGVANNGVMTKSNYIFRAEHFETIRRTRQKLQERHPELKANDQVIETRNGLRVQKGMWIFDNQTNTVSYQQI